MNCELCGTSIAPGSTVCPTCGAQIGGEAAPVAVRENVALGTVGALVGALLGGASIILLSRLGYIASLCGVLIAFATLGGYKLLAKGMGKVGLIICFVLMLVTPFAAYNLDLLLQCYEEWKVYGLTMGDSVTLLLEIMQEDSELMFTYLKELGMLYLFMILGAFSIVKNALKGN